MIECVRGRTIDHCEGCIFHRAFGYDAADCHIETCSYHQLFERLTEVSRNAKRTI